ncbi:general stress protein [Phaeobacter inhibens]|uniref:pyridoxamine 5'-phosphate oxidase family protein n=1 Tax=Phaeobacter inhibens TaxID=221822 RepID=UPI000971889C|nr:pyridoxamine 5'-phosphate oxidase family protein [Phaeobacter inhibens]APX15563.1 general stress protein [Phaeobacter inhibens]
MARQTETKDDAISQLWHQLEKRRTSMLAVRDSEQQPQPMTHFADVENGAIWFISSSDSDLVKATGLGADAQLTFVSDGQDYHASVRGPIEVSNDPDKLDELWSFAVGAWFEKGRDDPKVTLLRMTPREAAVWASQGNAVLVGLKLLRASMSETEGHPDVGVHHVLQLNT